MPMELRDRFRGALLGLAAGDAVGTAVEFRPRGTFVPLTEMIRQAKDGRQPSVKLALPPSPKG